MKKLKLLSGIKMSNNNIYIWSLFIGSLLITACGNSERQKQFEALPSKQTGITFSNNLHETDTLNYFLYKYMYMGGGVAIGDVNNDGLQDVYFTGNMVDNKLYLNQGKLKFKDITNQAKVAGEKGRWITGVTMADVNADGWLDIYVCVAGMKGDKRNLLYINDAKEGQNPTFTEAAEQYGVADRGNSVQSVFFDYDLDGDLDLYVANYPITDTKTGVYNYREIMKYVTPDKSDHLYRNNGNGKFEDVTTQSGVLKFGLSLGISVGDYNQDGWPDLYVSNDFATPDYFFFNNGDGTFTNKLENVINHTAFYGMGVDAADFNNDGLLDIAQVDMTPEDNFKSKANMASMNIPVFHAMVNNGMYYQYMKNALQMNMGMNEDDLPQFGEISQLANVSLTDWSWAPLLADFDNDGWKDLFITNGSRREINGKDFFKEMNKDKTQRAHYLDWVKKMPAEKVENYALKNNGGLSFEPIAKEWGINFKGWSNGSAYADLDNDGDLDLIINNIDDQCILYKNNASDKKENGYLRVKLQGSEKNKFGLGAKVTLKNQGQIQFQELTLTRGFQSSVEPILHFGTSNLSKIETLIVVWPDGKKQEIKDINANQQITLYYKDAVEMNTDKERVKIDSIKFFKNISEAVNLKHKHTENNFDDFKHQLLLPHKMSQNGPALAVGDINNDSLDDFYIGGAKGFIGQFYTQTKEGLFEALETEVFLKDKTHEDVDALFFDANNDGWLDLYVVSGGNEAKSGRSFYQDRLYINSKNGQFTRSENGLPKIIGSGSVVKAHDFDGDGDKDLFIGGRLDPRNYPLPGVSYLLKNESIQDQVKFTDVTLNTAPELSNIGMVTDAVWADIDNDEQKELVITGEWMPITVFKLTGSKFENMTQKVGLQNDTGWWYSINAQDFDADGDIDLVAGNLGENYKYKASKETPFSIYSNDFDKNKKNDIVLSYIQKGEEYPVRGRQCSAEQIPAIKVKFEDYNSFAKASLEDIYSTQALNESTRYQAVNFSNSYLENKGGRFSIKSLESLAQLSSINAIHSEDINGDGHLDIVLAGNLYNSEVETPRNDASYGLYMEGDGKGNFKGVMPYESGLMIKGEVKKIKKINLANGAKALLVAKNNEELEVIQLLQ